MASEGRSVHAVVERREAIRKAIELARPGDTILLAGKGHERSIIWNGVKHPWDEAMVAREELARAGLGPMNRFSRRAVLASAASRCRRS